MKSLVCLLFTGVLSLGAVLFGETYLKPQPTPTPTPADHKPVEKHEDCKCEKCTCTDCDGKCDTTTDPVVDHAEDIKELRTALGGLAIKHDVDLTAANGENSALKEVIADYKTQLDAQHQRGDEFATQLQDFSDRLDAIPGDVAGDDCRLLLEDVKQRQKLLLHAFDLFGKTGKYYTEDCTYNHPTPCTTPAWRGN